MYCKKESAFTLSNKLKMAFITLKQIRNHEKFVILPLQIIETLFGFKNFFGTP